MPPLAQHVDFRYTNIQRIRDEGVTVAELSNANAIRLIQFYSNRINQWTSQWFYPVLETSEENGKGSIAVWRSDLMPILKLDSVKIDFAKSTDPIRNLNLLQVASGIITLASNLIQLTTAGRKGSPDRIIELVAGTSVPLLSSVGRFPRGARNIEITGTFGWIIQKAEISTTTAASLASNATSLVLISGTNIEQNDVVRIGVDPHVYVLVTSVSGNTINFDDIGTITTVASGGTAVTFGKVPDGIRYACERLVIHFRNQFDTSNFQEAIDESQIISEKIGDYSYLKQIPKYMTESMTGLRDVDMVLSEFLQPNIPHFV